MLINSAIQFCTIMQWIGDEYEYQRWIWDSLHIHSEWVSGRHSPNWPILSFGISPDFLLAMNLFSRNCRHVPWQLLSFIGQKASKNEQKHLCSKNHVIFREHAGVKWDEDSQINLVWTLRGIAYPVTLHAMSFYFLMDVNFLEIKVEKWLLLSSAHAQSHWPVKTGVSEEFFHLGDGWLIDWTNLIMSASVNCLPFVPVDTELLC